MLATVTKSAKALRGLIMMDQLVAPLLLISVCLIPGQVYCGTLPYELKIVDRLTWGGNASSYADITAEGLNAWIDDQLNASTSDDMPPAIQAEINILSISRYPVNELVARIDNQTRAANAIRELPQRQAAQKDYQQVINILSKEATKRQILRDIYSKSQLKEVMTWFWFNHFNVFEWKSDILPMIGEYEDSAIRPNVFGKFRSLLEAALLSPAMLRYLDNSENSLGHSNENFAREILELHTMGVGSGYTQADVQALARILTGINLKSQLGMPEAKQKYLELIRGTEYEFDPKKHDFGDKKLLGVVIKGRGFSEFEDALDIITRQPATARKLSLELAEYFVSQSPPVGLVDRMALKFRQTDGDISEVLRTMIYSPEFKQSLGSKTKDPVRFVISAMRQAYSGETIVDTYPIQNWITQLGEGFYNRETPDGYPLVESAWSSSGQLEARIEVAEQIASNSSSLFHEDGKTNEGKTIVPNFQNAFYEYILRGTLSRLTASTIESAGGPIKRNLLYLCSPDFSKY